jgi:signal transduction histidine kinase
MSASSVAAADGERGRWTLTVLLAQALPLLAVRQLPRTVLVLTAFVTAVSLGAGLPVTNGTVAQAIAVAFVVAGTHWPASALVPVAVLVPSVVGAWAGHATDLSRFTVVTGASLGLAWMLGDAYRRRAAVNTAIEAELTRRARHHRLQAEVGAVSERLAIAKELHNIVGEGLDAVIVQAAAARTRLGTAEATQSITAIETVARQVLTELDRFLALLRREVPERDTDRTAPAPPVVIPENRRFAWLETRAPAVTLVGTAAAVSALTLIDVAGVPGTHAAVPGWWPVAFSTAVGAALLARRRWPEATLTVLTVLIAGHLAAGIPVDNGVVSIPVAAHALMAQRGRGRGISLAAAACILPATATAVGEPSAAVQVATVLGVLTAIALYVGDTARVARHHNQTLLRRLADVEAEGALRQQAVVVEERTAAARDLHDSVGHALSLIIIQAGAARLGAGAGRSAALKRADDALAAIEQTARSSLASVEVAVSADKRHGSNAALSPPGDIEDLVDGVRATGATVHLDNAATGDLSQSLQSTVYRLVQEALTNAVKHAPGSTTTVLVDRSEDSIRIRVTNDRASRTSDALPSGGRGLTGMRERVALFGGTLNTGPTSDGGYVVDATVPVPKRFGDVDQTSAQVGGRQ